MGELVSCPDKWFLILWQKNHVSVSVLDDGDVLYMHASTNAVHPLDAVFRAGLFSFVVKGTGHLSLCFADRSGLAFSCQPVIALKL